MLGLMARKVGMTQIFDDEGNFVPVTVLRIDPNTVIARKEKEKYGYESVVLGVGDVKKNKVSKPEAGQFPDGITPKKTVREVRDFEKDVKAGDSLGVELFVDCNYVDVTGISKGKGFQGVVRRHNFSGGRRSHGSKFHRTPGSTGQATFPHRTFKNTKLPGRMGREQVTVLSLKLIKVDTEKNLLMIRGAVPGINKGLVFVRSAVKR